MRGFIERARRQNKWLFDIYIILLYSIREMRYVGVQLTCIRISDGEAEIMYVYSVSGIANEIISRDMRRRYPHN